MTCDNCVSCEVCHAVKLASKMDNADVLCEHFVDKDLINRQKAEIERLQNESIGKCELAMSMRSDHSIDVDCNYCVEQAKAEAVKEFADLAIKKICENVTPIPQQRYLVKMCIEEIENTKKEMVGEADV